MAASNVAMTAVCNFLLTVLYLHMNQARHSNALAVYRDFSSRSVCPDAVVRFFMMCYLVTKITLMNFALHRIWIAFSTRRTR